MGKTLHYGRRGNRAALEARINRHVLHRGTAAYFDAVQAAAIEAVGVANEVTRQAMGPQRSYVTFRDDAPRFGRRLPPR